MISISYKVRNNSADGVRGKRAISVLKNDLTLLLQSKIVKEKLPKEALLQFVEHSINLLVKNSKVLANTN